MRRLVLSSIIGLSACASAASSDRRCEEMEAKLAETTARLDETTARLAEAVRRIGELEARAEARDDRLRRVEQPLEREPAGDSTSETAAPGEPDLDRIVSCEGGRCTITRAGLDQIFTNPSWLARQARIVPSIRDGEHEGFKLYGIRRNSLPARLEFENGDLVVAINGQPLGSVEQAMQLYVELGQESVSKLEFDVRRNDASKKLTLHIE